jgi:hypothetical protein
MASVAVGYSFHGWNGSCGGCQEDIEATCALVVERIEQLDDKVNDIYRRLRRRIHTSSGPMIVQPCVRRRTSAASRLRWISFR